MQTDWVLVRRLAAELDEQLRGGRIATVGLLPDGRFAIDVRGGRAGRARLVVDAFAATPLAWLASPELAALDLRAAPGWSRAFADSLEGRRVEALRGRTGDRLIALDARARSRFGVDSDVRLVLELVPKFGNLVMLKDQTIVAAAREFEPAASSSAGRTTVAGGAYEPPPLPAPRPDSEAERAALVAFARADVAGIARALRRERPLLTPLVAASLAAAAAERPRSSGEALRAETLAAADAALASFERRGEIVAYRSVDGDRLVQGHVMELIPFERDPAVKSATVPALEPLLRELAERVVVTVAKDSFERRRAQLVQRLERRLHAVRASYETTDRERDDEGRGDRLRLAGEALFTHYAEIAPGATRFDDPDGSLGTIELDPALDARGNATAIFKRYRKLANRRVHAERRLGELGTELAALEELAWELARAEPETLPELSRTMDDLVPTGAARDPRRKLPSAKRGNGRPATLRPHRFDLGDGARLLVGRSPQGNAELTFRLARPDDWWFHARGVPGAHVVLQFDDGREPTEREFEIASEAAAAYSSAARAARVDVDRTRRKHVRKRDAGPGQVWYVDAQTLAVRPVVPNAAVSQ